MIPDMSYRYLRDRLIEIAILTPCGLVILYEAVTGKKPVSHATLILLVLAIVVGPAWVAYLTLRAKKRERLSRYGKIHRQKSRLR